MASQVTLSESTHNLRLAAMSLEVISREATRDLVKSGVGLIGNMVLIHILVTYSPITDVIAPILSLSILIVAAYIATDRWTFRNRQSPDSLINHSKLFGGFLVAYGGGQLVKYGIYLIILPFFQYLIAWPMAAGSGFAISFGLSRFAWRRV